MTLLVLLSIFIMLLHSWRKKNALHKNLEQFLEDINDQQNARKKHLARQLGIKLKQSKNDAEQLGEQLVDAEKKFLQCYVTQVIQQMPSNTLYTELTEVLDLYVNNLSKHLQDDETKAAKSAHALNTREESNSSEEPAPTAQNPEQEPDWGDVFD